MRPTRVLKILLLALPCLAVEPGAMAPTTITARLGTRRLGEALAATGLSREETERAVRALSKIVDARRLLPADSLRVVRAANGRLLHVTFNGRRARVVLIPKEDGTMKPVARPLSVVRKEARAAGVVEGSLWASMEKAGVPAEIIVEFTDVFRWNVDFLTESRDGDRFAVVWSEAVAEDGRRLGRAVEAASYVGPAAGERTALRFTGSYYDPAGESLRRRFLRAPLSFSRVSSRFSKARRHPVLGWTRPHRGIDYAAPRGTPIHAVADGVVTMAGREGGFGNVVKVRHGEIYSTLYGHLHRFARGLRAGRRVEQGQVLGYVGSTGLATGPHLHFQFEKRGEWVDFLKADAPFASPVPAARRPAFEREKRRLLEALGKSGPISA